ncbi:GNAT family N-acetyltransferase [Haloarcula sp. S1CR25-12]|uniref:GNAT family N-acetyltransferase n=1 Tax=Haloarcula saliterrae TaxID=2950534 RepID=A0ABU2FC07_9EURY|nr:GNAT family N-acetyltransferase [Haloarcula sp. S1CR25-12]MDS0259381.1 GNAT family N-acetyltransferase [Haloarcula sp. S1CR25-12]
MSSYTIRWYRPGDRAQYLDLYADVLDTWSHSPEWFDWKYVSNPYVDHVPIVVATENGDLVGARSFFALPMTVGGDEYGALEPCDTMVRPDHRRQGLFTRMTERAIERYEDRERAFFFNFPNEVTLRGNEKLGWQRVGSAPLAYRVENVTPFLTARTTAPGAELAGAVGTRLASAYNRLRERRRRPQPAVSVRHEQPVPVEQLAGLYETTAPDTIHAHRDAQFYRWRLSNPNWDYSAFVAESGEARAAVVVARVPAGKLYGPEVTRIVDVLPLTGHDRREPLVRALVARVQSAFPTSDLFVAPSTLPRGLLRDYGFHHDDTAPLSYLTDERPHLVRALDSWTPAGKRLTESDNWTTTLLETDTG